MQKSGIFGILEYSEPFHNCIPTHTQHYVIFTKIGKPSVTLQIEDAGQAFFQALFYNRWTVVKSQSWIESWNSISSCFVVLLFFFFFYFWKNPPKISHFIPLFSYSFFGLDTYKNAWRKVTCILLFFETRRKTLKFQEKSERARKKEWRKVRKSVGNAFPNDLET